MLWFNAMVCAVVYIPVQYHGLCHSLMVYVLVQCHGLCCGLMSLFMSWSSVMG